MSSAKSKSAASLKRQAQMKKSKSTVIKRNNPHSKHTKIEVTKKINKKIESEIAAKAVSAGIKFKFDDLSKRGEQTVQRQIAMRNKKELAKKRRTRGADGQYSK